MSDNLLHQKERIVPQETVWHTIESAGNHILVASEKALRNVFGDNAIDKALTQYNPTINQNGE